MNSRPYKIVIDPGHGGADPGAVNESVRLSEADLNLQFAKALERHVLGGDYLFSVKMTHRGLGKSLHDRCSMSNLEEPNAFVSLHCNAAESKLAIGHEVWTSPGQTPADGLATEIFDRMAPVFLGPGRSNFDDGDPDKESSFYVLRHTRAPAVLVELDFISNDTRARWLADPANQSRAAEHIADAIEYWLEGGM